MASEEELEDLERFIVNKMAALGCPPVPIEALSTLDKRGRRRLYNVKKRIAENLKALQRHLRLNDRDLFTKTHDRLNSKLRTQAQKYQRRHRPLDKVTVELGENERLDFEDLPSLKRQLGTIDRYIDEIMEI